MFSEPLSLRFFCLLTPNSALAPISSGARTDFDRFLVEKIPHYDQAGMPITQRRSFFLAPTLTGGRSVLRRFSVRKRSPTTEWLGWKNFYSQLTSDINKLMLDKLELTALVVAATLACAYIAHRAGWVQIGIIRDAHVRDLKKATPKVNSRVLLVMFHPTNRPDVTRYAVYTKIYNDGDLVARKLEGEWKLTASHGINEARKVIRADSLPASLPLPMKHEVTGRVESLRSDPKVVLQVDIKLSYLALDGAPEQYRATYDYDFQYGCLVQRKET